MRGNVIETVMGAVVLVVAALFLVFAYRTSQLRTVGRLRAHRRFRADRRHSPGQRVRISGIKVGSVVADELDPKTFLATMRMSIDPAVKLPDDTVAEIISSGLLGDKYMSLVPGGSDKMIPPGGKIKYTQSSVSLENLIGQMIFSPPGARRRRGRRRSPLRKAAPGGGPARRCAGNGRPQVSTGQASGQIMAETDTVDFPVWRTPEGEPVSCVEKIKVLNENLAELRALAQDALEDAVLMGGDERQVREVLAGIVAGLVNP